MEEDIDVAGEVEAQLEPVKYELATAVDDIAEANRRIDQLTNEVQGLKDEIEKLKATVSAIVRVIELRK